MANLYTIMLVLIVYGIYGVDRIAMGETVLSEPKVPPKVEVVLFDGVGLPESCPTGGCFRVLFIRNPNGNMCDILGRSELTKTLTPDEIFKAINDDNERRSVFVVTVLYDDGLSFNNVVDAIRRLVDAAKRNIKREKEIRIYLVVERSKEPDRESKP